MTSTGPVRPLVGTFILLASALGAHLLQGGEGRLLIQPAAFVLVVGSTLGMIIIGCGPGGLVGGLRALLFGSPDEQTDFGPLRRALYLVLHGAPLAGFVGTVLGFIHVLQSLDDPSHVGAAMAVNMVVLCYGVILAMIAYGLVVMVERRDGDGGASGAPTDEAEEGPTIGQGVVGTVLVLASIVVPHPLEGGDLMALLSVGAGLVVGGGILGAVLIPGVSLEHSASRGTLRVVVQAALLAGIAGAILGTIHMLGHLNDPSMIGPGVALAYLALFYGAIIAMIAHGWLARAGGGSEGGAGPPVGYSALYAVGALVIVMAIFFGILAVVP